MKNNKAQVTIFIIAAIIIVVAVAGFFFLRGGLNLDQLPSNLEPVYDTFLSCLENHVSVGIDVLESTGGYIELPDFEPGSEYMPFSSQLDFLGNPIPYWYYVSGNNIAKEQVPTKQNMQRQLATFVEERARDCIFDSYYEQGFEVTLGDAKATSKINDNVVELNLDMNFLINNTQQSALISNHRVEVQSSLGKLYDSAIEVYETEQATLFLEERGVDAVRIYAPVDGVELTCAPKIWQADLVFDELAQGIEASNLALKTKKGDYDLSREENKYYVLDYDFDFDVRFLNSRNWPSTYEVSPSEGSLMVAKTVGTQPGLGILGFCYAPYHFVYDAKYPVLVQVHEGDEIFQFPLAIVVAGNKPRVPLENSFSEVPLVDLCKYKNSEVTVSTYDLRFNPIKAEISYECFGLRCEIGETNLISPLVEDFPQCVNGFVRAKAEGYKDTRYPLSTNEGGSVEIFMDKLYEKRINLKVNGRDYSGEALITFKNGDESNTIVYPEQNTVELSEGAHEIQVHIYRESSLRIASTIIEQCVEVPNSGVGGLFGFTKEECYDIEVPEQIISNALSGGGQQDYYILEDELISSSVVEIGAESLPIPVSLEQLQDNYALYDLKGLEVNFN